MRRSFIVGALVLGLAAAPAMAQVPLVPGALSIAAGVVLPQGDGNALYKKGLTASAACRIGIRLKPFAVRAEAGWRRFDAKRSTGMLGQSLSVTGATQLLSGGAAEVMTVLPLIVFRG